MIGFVTCALLLASANAFSLKPSFTKRMSSRAMSTTEEQQTVKDLNLEEMFEVFDAADKKIAPVEVKAEPTPVKLAPFEAKKQVGSSAPFGFFDPAGYTIDVTEEQFKLYQEAEIKHGRVSMLAFVGFIFGEVFHPFFNGQIDGPAIYQFQQADAIFPQFWIVVTTFIAMIEGQTIISAWQPLEETLREPLGIAKLRSSHEPGNLKFDPLKLKPRNDRDYKAMKTKEINNGRLAMLAVAGMVAQELVTNTPIF